MKSFGRSLSRSGLCTLVLNATLSVLMVFLLAPQLLVKVASQDMLLPPEETLPAATEEEDYQLEEYWKIPSQPREPVSISIFELSTDRELDIISSRGNITIHAPLGMVEAAVEIELVEHAVEDKPGMQTLNLFELNASELNSEEQVTSFSKEFEITIRHTPDELVNLDADSLRLYYLDEESGNWVPVSSSRYDPENMVLTATVDHFT